MSIEHEIKAHLALNAAPHVKAIEHAIYQEKDPAAVVAAVKAAEKHVAAMKKLARTPPRHPGSSYLVDSRGEYDPHMYDLANLLVDAKKRVKLIKKSARPGLAKRTAKNEQPYEGMPVVVTNIGAKRHGVRVGLRGTIKRLSSADRRFGPPSDEAMVLVSVHGTEFASPWPTDALKPA